jgi:hypothetical protein
MGPSDKISPLPTAIPAIVPRGGGHQFVCYADACSGVPGAPHEATFAAVNAVVSRLRPQPEFICFPGDEVIGLTADDETLRAQWRHWFDVEMAWLDRNAIPLYHTTANHTTYDARSEAVFQEMMAHLPSNGPPGQDRLSYVVRRGDLLLVFVNTFWSGLGGEGRVEHTWLDQTLLDNADARYKLVLGHHPIHPVNGFSGAYAREVALEDGRALWGVLVRHGVLAYLCSHILAFDVQVHDGVLQILTAGAGTAHRMPEGIEYLHCVQAALDPAGLRYQVLDTSGRIREWLDWPLRLPTSNVWDRLSLGVAPAPAAMVGPPAPRAIRVVAWRCSGTCAPEGDGEPQTLVSAWDDGPALAPLWIGLLGRENRLGVLISPAPGRSPALWLGPLLTPGAAFDVQLAIHTGMGPGGILWRPHDGAPWSSLAGMSPWGAERLTWPAQWCLGHGQRGADDRPFRGGGLRAAWQAA